MAVTFPRTLVANGTEAESLLTNGMTASGMTDPTGGLSLTDKLCWIAGELMRNGGTGLSVTNAITAFATGGQASATALTSPVNRITVSATALDSVKLAAATAGAQQTVINDGAAAANIYPVTGETINGLAANFPIGLAAGSETTLVCVVAGAWIEVAAPKLPYAKFTTINVTAGTLAAGDATGAATVNLTSTNATPGTQTTRTATQMFTDNPNARVGDSYLLIISNSGANTFTLAAGSGVTLTGTATIATAIIRFYIVTYTSATALVIQNIGAGVMS